MLCYRLIVSEATPGRDAKYFEDTASNMEYGRARGTDAYPEAIPKTQLRDVVGRVQLHLDDALEDSPFSTHWHSEHLSVNMTFRL